jgi:hypothetical protein
MVWVDPVTEHRKMEMRSATLRAGLRRKEGSLFSLPTLFGFACARLQGGLTHFAPLALVHRGCKRRTLLVIAELTVKMFLRELPDAAW